MDLTFVEPQPAGLYKLFVKKSTFLLFSFFQVFEQLVI